MREHRIGGVWPAAERLAVLVDYRACAKDLLRKAWRFGQGLKVDTITAVVVSDRARLTLPGRTALASTEHLAEDLEITVVDLPQAAPGCSLPDRLVAFLRERNVTHLMLGQAPRNRLEIALPHAGRWATACRPENVHPVYSGFQVA